MPGQLGRGHMAARRLAVPRLVTDANLAGHTPDTDMHSICPLHRCGMRGHRSCHCSCRAGGSLRVDRPTKAWLHVSVTQQRHQHMTVCLCALQVRASQAGITTAATRGAGGCHSWRSRLCTGLPHKSSECVNGHVQPFGKMVCLPHPCKLALGTCCVLQLPATAATASHCWCGTFPG